MKKTLKLFKFVCVNIVLLCTVYSVYTLMIVFISLELNVLKLPLNLQYLLVLVFSPNIIGIS